MPDATSSTVSSGETGQTDTTTSEEVPSTEPPKLPDFDPPNYKYKVLKYYREDYITPLVFVLIGLIIIILTIAFHYYMDSKERQRQIAPGMRYKPDKRKRVSPGSDSPDKPPSQTSPVASEALPQKVDSA